MATQNEQALAQQLFGGAQPSQSMGALGAVKEAFLTVAPGLKDFGADIKSELKQQLAHGAHELAAALFSNGNNGFVMYPRGGKDDHGVHGPEQAPDHGLGTQGMQDQGARQVAPSQEMERGGRRM